MTTISESVSEQNLRLFSSERLWGEIRRRNNPEVSGALRIVVDVCHGQARKAGWWNDLTTGEDLRGKRNVGELLCLIHSEISEAMEGHRKSLMDDHLPHRSMLEAELADALIRICDVAAGLGLDLPGAVEEKLAYNANRADHKRENRVKPDGKKY